MFNGSVMAKNELPKTFRSTYFTLAYLLKSINEKIIKAKNNQRIIKHLSIFLPHKALGLMYEAMVRSHLD